jgi:thiol-disulfide isomerase/thioredoxin
MSGRVYRPSLGLVVSLAVLLSVGACAKRRGSVRPQPTIVGLQLALAAPDLAGRERDVGTDQGVVRVVDFWASWCDPCRDAMPALDAIAKDLGPRGVAVYAVAFDEDRGQVAAFLEKTPVSFPVLWDRGGERWSGRFEISRLPTTILVDRKGTIRWVQDGWSASKARETRRRVEALLAE